jgi:hypothetical protein
MAMLNNRRVRIFNSLPDVQSPRKPGSKELASSIQYAHSENTTKKVECLKVLTEENMSDQKSARKLYISMSRDLQIWTPAAMLSSAPAREVAEVE